MCLNSIAHRCTTGWQQRENRQGERAAKKRKMFQDKAVLRAKHPVDLNRQLKQLTAGMSQSIRAVVDVGMQRADHHVHVHTRTYAETIKHSIKAFMDQLHSAGQLWVWEDNSCPIDTLLACEVATEAVCASMGVVPRRSGMSDAEVVLWDAIATVADQRVHKEIRNKLWQLTDPSTYANRAYSDIMDHYHHIVGSHTELKDDRTIQFTSVSRCTRGGQCSTYGMEAVSTDKRLAHIAVADYWFTSQDHLGSDKIHNKSNQRRVEYTCISDFINRFFLQRDDTASRCGSRTGCYGFRRTKIQPDTVKLPRVLALAFHTDSQVFRTCDKLQVAFSCGQVRYRLTSIFLKSSGHYIARFLHPDGVWYEYNDMSSQPPSLIRSFDDTTPRGYAVRGAYYVRTKSKPSRERVFTENQKIRYTREPSFHRLSQWGGELD